MNKKIVVRFLIIWKVFVVYGCQIGPTTNHSGPCDYTSERFEMKILDIVKDSLKENMYVVLVDFDGNIPWANKPQNLMDVRSVVTDYDFVVNNHLKPGLVYTGTYHQKVPDSGDCEEFFVDWEQKMR